MINSCNQFAILSLALIIQTSIMGMENRHLNIFQGPVQLQQPFPERQEFHQFVHAEKQPFSEKLTDGFIAGIASGVGHVASQAFIAGAVALGYYLFPSKEQNEIETIKTLQIYNLKAEEFLKLQRQTIEQQKFAAQLKADWQKLHGIDPNSEECILARSQYEHALSASILLNATILKQKTALEQLATQIA